MRSATVQFVGERKPPLVREGFAKCDPVHLVDHGRLRYGDQNIRSVHSEPFSAHSARAEHPVVTVDGSVQTYGSNNRLSQAERLTIRTQFVTYLDARVEGTRGGTGEHGSVGALEQDCRAERSARSL
ncbi:MAG: hypothetical protein WKF73_01495 [Nocardioidaceae bacterium]